MFGNRGTYHDGWVACTRHSIPWLMVANPPLANDVWELYNMTEDFSQANDLAAKNPAKRKELQSLFMKEAAKNHALPIDDRRSERFNAAIPKTQPFAFSADEGADVGVDGETAVSNDHKQGGNKFTGKIDKVTIDTKPSNLSAADNKALEDAEATAAAIED